MLQIMRRRGLQSGTRPRSRPDLRFVQLRAAPRTPSSQIYFHIVSPRTPSSQTYVHVVSPRTRSSQNNDRIVLWRTRSSKTYVHVVSLDYSEFSNIRPRSVIDLLRVLRSTKPSFAGELRVLKHTMQSQFGELNHGKSHCRGVCFRTF